MDLDAQSAIQRMHALGFNSEWIATSTGLSGQTIRKVASGNSQPTIPTVLKIMALESAVNTLQNEIKKIQNN